jgi:hypothetical protein
MSVAALNDAYRNEKDVNIRERILIKWEGASI